MKIPQLRKKPELKSCHNKTWEDDYSWIHQKNILEVLKDSSKLLPEIKEYLEEENKYFDHQMSDTKNLRKKLFEEIKSINTHGTRAGQWSARKAQYLAKKYKALGGGYY